MTVARPFGHRSIQQTEAPVPRSCDFGYTRGVDASQLKPDDLLPWIQLRFSRSAGPGGQNVNKVNTRVTVLFDVAACSLFSDDEKSRIFKRLSNRLASDGRIQVSSGQQRSQAANRIVANKRLVELLQRALRPRTIRHKTRPTRASQRRRVEGKRRRSETKKLRNDPRWD